MKLHIMDYISGLSGANESETIPLGHDVPTPSITPRYALTLTRGLDIVTRRNPLDIRVWLS